MKPTILKEPMARVFGQTVATASKPNVTHDDSDPLALDVDGVKKSYGNQQALRGVSFQVKRGERIALLGPNGAGKTTLIRCISGRVRLDEGRVHLFGKPTTNPFALHSLGVVPQDLAIYQDLTARENLECFGRLHGLRGRGLREQVSWALRWIALEDRADELTGRFSGGMKRRVNIACGVMHKPGVLLLDEPTVGVDPQSRQRIFDMLDELRLMGTSIVLTTHHLDEAEQRSDRIVIVDHGTVIADGTIQELLEQTVGSERRVVFEISGQLSSPPDGLTWDENRKRFSCSVHNLLEELPIWISKFEDRGGQVHDLEVHTPNLH
ncbi:MAG: ABC transporter ATP-binding protein, partial [Planctomycetes bacterium]|nr:ABC transporter ATP-binding protein [Planctomycetota bacterium]